MADLSKETLAAYDYVDRVVDTADDKVKLMWHGWALRDAFIAGAMWQSTQHGVEPTECEHAHINIAKRTCYDCGKYIG